ncbi:hypothetical protein GUJ93_ZPchr0337g7082 [Zizania palustris]|uniref:Serine hydroxymethyltransferase-like domain-containing protein n=1 Tax=Zizania palustris TaxID=103762 RepID=A0A8J5R5A5_ZIZPA|nr:hypothetical protein GUJ93_ZPchr0337g7082 [Zizania palustris]
MLEKSVVLFRPKLIVASASAYARLYDYACIRKVCDKQKEYYSQVTPWTTWSHDLYRKGVKEINKQGKEVTYDLEDKINAAIFPGLQGGPHNHTITGLVVALKQVCNTSDP